MIRKPYLCEWSLKIKLLTLNKIIILDISLVIIDMSSSLEFLCPLMAAFTLEIAWNKQNSPQYISKNRNIYQTIFMQPGLLHWSFHITMDTRFVLQVLLKAVAVRKVGSDTQQFLSQQYLITLKVFMNTWALVIKFAPLTHIRASLLLLFIPIELPKAHHSWFLIEAFHEART